MGNRPAQRAHITQAPQRLQAIRTLTEPAIPSTSILLTSPTASRAHFVRRYRDRHSSTLDPADSLQASSSMSGCPGSLGKPPHLTRLSRSTAPLPPATTPRTPPGTASPDDGSATPHQAHTRGTDTPAHHVGAVRRGSLFARARRNPCPALVPGGLALPSVRAVTRRTTVTSRSSAYPHRIRATADHTSAERARNHPGVPRHHAIQQAQPIRITLAGSLPVIHAFLIPKGNLNIQQPTDPAPHLHIGIAAVITDVLTTQPHPTIYRPPHDFPFIHPPTVATKPQPHANGQRRRSVDWSIGRSVSRPTASPH